MTTKQNIQFGERMLKEYSDMMDTIDLLESNKDDKKTIEFLLGMQRLEIEGRIDGTKSKLERFKKQYVGEFEKESSECNFRIQDVVKEASKYIGQEPVGVTDKIKPLADKFRKDDVWMDLSQEDRNDVYFELKAHLYVFKNKMK